MDKENLTYSYKVVPLQRNGHSLHLDCMWADGSTAGGTAGSTVGGTAGRSILLTHGSSCSSHIFDLDYRDYSFARRLAREGYAVWRLDITGYGRSEEVEDGLLPDTACAAEDIAAAVETITRETGHDRIDMLGWSWGTMTAGRFAAAHPEHLQKLVLYGPVLFGFGSEEITEPFHHNTWETAAEDFQLTEDGRIDHAVADPVVVGIYCSNCWRYDKETSPNGWRKDVFVDHSEKLIDLESISVPTLVICGDSDPYMEMDAIMAFRGRLPEGSELKVIPGGSHILIYEKHHYRNFQDSVIRFLGTGRGEY